MSKETVAKPKRTRRTKSEIQEELDIILKEDSKPKSSSKADELAKIQEQELIDSVKTSSQDDVIHKFANFNIEVSKTLSDLSEKIIQEIQTLSKLRQVVQLEKVELERLHKIDITQTALDDLIEAYQAKKEESQQELEDLHAQIENETQERENQLAEDEELLSKTRKRETEEYEYKKNLERKKSQDKYEEEIRLRDKNNKEKQEALERSWHDREQALKAQETEVATLKTTVQEFPGRLKAEIDKAVSAAILQTEQKLAHQIELLKRDSEAEKRISDLKIKTLEETLARQLSLASTMQGQVDEAKKQVQDIAVKAIEGASGAKAFQIALEQSKSRTTGA